ncbi:AAA family ATPase [Aphanizomenon sp. PH219]|nr:AAA family ATPase [Aphanizomenon sp. 202]MDK2459442.1 AAA family ATPase [Aphanizomenon sp. PH219]
MIINQLDLNQVRGFQRAILNFQPGFNLLVGENGTGKSTVLWSLRVILSHIFKTLSFSKEPVINFTEHDISSDPTQQWPFLSAKLNFNLDVDGLSIPLIYDVQKNRQNYIEGKAGQPREQVVDTPDVYKFLKSVAIPNSDRFEQQPIAVFYSAHRSIASEKSVSKRKTIGSKYSAYMEALQERELMLGEVAELWHKEAELNRTDGFPERANTAITQALPIFLNGFSNLRVEGDQKRRLFVDKYGVKLDLTQISDGERSLLAILMDLTRRLSQANPSLQNPAKEAKSIVLIDEIDLHLHPRWQRTIVEKLSETFPNCQFIATTHSPQIIGELPQEKIIFLENGKPPYHPSQALGMDSNWVLTNLMHVDDRKTLINNELVEITQLIKREQYEKATDKIDALRIQVKGAFPELVRLQSRIDRIRLLGE